MRPEVSAERKLCEQGRTMAGAGRGKKGSFVTSVARTSPEEKLFLARRGVFFLPLLLLCRPHGKGKLRIRHTGRDL